MSPTAGSPAPRPEDPPARPETGGDGPDARIVAMAAVRGPVGGPASTPGVAASKVARMLATVGGTTALHHRAVPGIPGVVVDHVVVAAGGIVAVTTASVRGPITVSRAHVGVADVDRTDLVAGIEQIASVLSTFVEGIGIGSHLCLVDGEFVEAGPKRCRDTDVSGIAGLRRRIEKLRVVDPGRAPLEAAQVSTRLDARLHPAV